MSWLLCGAWPAGDSSRMGTQRGGACVPQRVMLESGAHLAVAGKCGQVEGY